MNAPPRRSVNIEIKGVKQTVRALESFAPDLYAALNKDIRESLDETREGAKGRYPSGSWSIRVNKKRLLGQIIATPGRRDDNKWSNSSPGVRAAIFEFVGTNYPTPKETPQVRGLIDSLNARYGMPGRFLWDAWDASGERVLGQIRGSVLDAEKKLQRRLDAAGEAY